MESSASLGREWSLTQAATRWAADAVSLSRVALLVPLAWFETSRSPWALGILAAIVASDLIDGPIARRLGTAGSRGALIDAACDVVVVVGAAVAAGLSDLRYAWLASIMTLSFLSYGGLSSVIGRFAYTRLGRYSGTVSYGVIAMASAKPLLAAIGVAAPAAVEWVLLGFAGIYLAAAAAENVAGILAARDRRSQQTAG